MNGRVSQLELFLDMHASPLGSFWVSTVVESSSKLSIHKYKINLLTKYDPLNDDAIYLGVILRLVFFQNTLSVYHTKSAIFEKIARHDTEYIYCDVQPIAKVSPLLALVAEANWILKPTGHRSPIRSAHCLLICCLSEWPTEHCPNDRMVSPPPSTSKHHPILPPITA